MGYKKEIHILLGNWNTNKQLSLLNKARVIHGPHDPPLWEKKNLVGPNPISGLYSSHMSLCISWALNVYGLLGMLIVIEFLSHQCTSYSQGIDVT